MSDVFDKTRESKEEILGKGSARQFLTFTIGQEEYGVDIMTVREIKGWSETTRLPNTPDFMRGVINLRGLIIPIFDLRARFHLGLTEADAKNVVIILAVDNRTIGILVDTVSDILDTNEEQIKAAPASQTHAKDQCVDGLISNHDRMVVLLCVNKLFDTELLKKLENFSGDKTQA
ncbi:MAG: chemotaxis protein CheW [Pseudomonadota bacterium]